MAAAHAGAVESPAAGGAAPTAGRAAEAAGKDKWSTTKHRR